MEEYEPGRSARGVHSWQIPESEFRYEGGVYTRQIPESEIRSEGGVCTLQILESYYISGVCTWQMSEFRSDQRKG